MDIDKRHLTTKGLINPHMLHFSCRNNEVSIVIGSHSGDCHLVEFPAEWAETALELIQRALKENSKPAFVYFPDDMLSSSNIWEYAGVPMWAADHLIRPLMETIIEFLKDEIQREKSDLKRTNCLLQSWENVKISYLKKITEKDKELAAMEVENNRLLAKVKQYAAMEGAAKQEALSLLSRLNTFISNEIKTMKITD